MFAIGRRCTMHAPQQRSPPVRTDEQADRPGTFLVGLLGWRGTDPANTQMVDLVLGALLVLRGRTSQVSERRSPIWPLHSRCIRSRHRLTNRLTRRRGRPLIGFQFWSMRATSASFFWGVLAGTASS